MTIKHWIIFIGVFAPAFGGLTFWMDQRGTIDTANLPSNTATPATLVASATPSTSAASATTAAPSIPATPATLDTAIKQTGVAAGFQSQGWTEVLQGRYGLMQVTYEIRGSAKEKIGTQYEYDDPGGHEIIFRNISNTPVHLIYIATWTDRSGQLIDSTVIDRILNPKEEDYLTVTRLRPSDRINSTALKIIAEAN